MQIWEGASGSVIISLLNLVCVFHDSLDVCMDCHVVCMRSGFKGGHGSGHWRLKHELPELLIGWFCTESRNGHMVLWNLVFAPRVHDKKVKNRKENRKGRRIVHFLVHRHASIYLFSIIYHVSLTHWTSINSYLILHSWIQHRARDLIATKSIWITAAES